MVVRSGDKHKVDVAWNIVFGKFLMLVGDDRESVKPLSFYCNTMPASLLVEHRIMVFYNKTLHSNNIVLRILCVLHRNEAQNLSSVYHIFQGHSSSFGIKRAVWSSFVTLLTV